MPHPRAEGSPRPQPADFAAPSVQVEHRADGSILLHPTLALGAYPPQIGTYLRDWAKRAPERDFLAERDAAGGWRRLSYAAAADAADRIAQWLIDHGFDETRPIAALSENSIDLALLKLGAMAIGVPFLPVSPAYSLLSESFAKLKYVLGEFAPRLIYAAPGAAYAKALAAAAPAEAVIVAEAAGAPPGAIPFAELLATTPTVEVERRFAAVGPDSIAKILLTSGSTGMPKGVINTQRMLCSNGVAVDQLWHLLGRRPPVIVDWLPWSHTFGTNFNLGQILRHGGTMYIDAGKPAPGRFTLTLRALAEIQPTLLYNVPRGYDLLVPALEADAAFAAHLLAELDIIFYAGAALPSHLWQRLDALALKHRGRRIPILSSLGATETAPAATLCHWLAEEVGGVGLPIPGSVVKLVPDGGKLEMRVKGANITPGYYRRPDLTAKAFDEEGFFRLGDAVSFIAAERPEAGLRFDGRVAENFKLMSGTWVPAGELRLAAISAAVPVIQDAVVTGQAREAVGLLIFPDLDGCRRICGDAAASLEALAAHPALHAHLRQSLAAHNRANVGSSRRIVRVLLLAEPPSSDGNEITDKGYLNQRAVLERRAALVERLYADEAATDVVIVEEAEP